MLLGSILAAVTFGASAQSWITNGLVAFYPFSGTPNDAVGSNHGTVVGAVLTTNRFGISNSAYRFDGASSRIEFASPPLTQVANWTLSAWINPASFSHTAVAVQMGFDNNNTGDGYGLGIESDASFFGAFSGVGFFSSGQTITNANRWYHVVMLRDTSMTKFFINGSQTLNTLSASPTTPTDFTIGSQNGVRFFDGLIDDVRIYNRALLPNEVSQLYDAESANGCTPHKAIAIATIVNGFVVGAGVIDTGCGYTNVPSVSFEGGGGSGATATATVDNGRVIAINVMSAGCCYTNPPKIVIDSPPSIPTISISVSKVKVIQNVTVGRNYVLESSFDLTAWTPTGPTFIAQSETVVTEFDSDATGRYFRIREVP